MAADSDSMRSVLGCPLLASWIAYKFYLSQDFNSIPALDTRPLRIPSLLLRKTVTLLPFSPSSTLLSAALDTSFYFLFFFFFFSSSVPSASLPPFSRYRRFTPRFHWNHATRNPTPLPSPVFLPFLPPFFFLFPFPSFDTFGWRSSPLLLCAAIKGDPVVLRHPCNKPV